MAAWIYSCFPIKIVSCFAANNYWSVKLHSLPGIYWEWFSIFSQFERQIRNIPEIFNIKYRYNILEVEDDHLFQLQVDYQLPQINVIFFHILMRVTSDVAKLWCCE